MKICIMIAYMLSEVHEFAPAKINLNLRVLPRRSDGFHAIESIFQTVSLSDELFVRLEDGKNICAVQCDSMALPAENTITATYKAFCLYTGFNQSVSVKLIKKIPSGGGLGGGSSDAASFAKALAKLSCIRFTAKLKDKIANDVGSDVFFFLKCGRQGCAVVSGRGEDVVKIEPRKDLHILLVFPGVHSSTKEAYALVDEYMQKGKIAECPALADLEAVYRRPVKRWSFDNSFTSAITCKYPEIGEALAEIRKAGASFADMSGSGSTVFGVFESVTAIENAFRVLILKGMKCAIA